MWIEWRKFTSDHWRFDYNLLFWSFCLGNLLTLALLSSVALKGQAGQTKPQESEKPRVDQSSLNLPNASASSVAKVGETRAVSAPASLEAAHPRIDVDLGRQMLTVTDASGNVVRTLPVSTGSGMWYVSEGEKRRAVTPTGHFRVHRKIPGWHKSPLGLMYYPVYIAGGVAIHGSPSVPRRPASHGCIRIPMYAAKAFYDSTPIGTIVVVHG